MQKVLLFFLVFTLSTVLLAQPAQPGIDKLLVPVVNDKQLPLADATVELLRSKDSVLIKAAITDTSGLASFQQVAAGVYLLRISSVNYGTHYSPPVQVLADESNERLAAIVLYPANTHLQGVTVLSKKPFIQQLPGKTIINVEAAITNAGTTAMEVLEKSPGVTVDKNGNISLKGRSGILIMIDNKPAYVSGTDLVNMLNSMSSNQVETIELITNPSAQYDAAGNAGIINIRTKKNKQKGFNGNISLAYGQGRYYKSNNSALMNYRNGRWNLFFNYSMNANKGFTDLYALRSYYKPDGKTIETLLDQPSWFTNASRNHTVRTGIDYAINNKTAIGLSLTGINSSRNGRGNNTAIWKDAQGTTDSIIQTTNSSKNRWKNLAANFNFRHSFSTKQELTADIDMLKYDINTHQAFQNNLDEPGGYEEAFKGDLPSLIDIVSFKADHTAQLPNSLKLQTGIKTSHISTDNTAAYFYKDGAQWKEDLGKTNHFLYTENIHAVYSNAEKKTDRWTLQAGLRYELTNYKANQLGNSQQKDSAFSRNYNSLFPSASINVEADSSNQFMLSAGRRIDRPAFQKLNPFLYIVNKYTYQRGNSLIRPQYTWNTEFSHVYKNILTTTVGYSITNDYFSQLFIANSDGTVIYTEGNFNRMRNISASVSANFSPLNCWSFTAMALFNHKRIEGVLWNDYVASIGQMNFNINNQFRFKKDWSAELSGFYTTKNQNDIQEILEPTGQVAVGIAKQVWKNRGTIRLTVRDIFYTQAMEGLTHFERADEYFKLQRDSRVCTLGFVYRFGKSFKSTKRYSGGASDEMQRVGNGN
ncbi:outer membrane beta-barrel protein [Terrimonas alba]|uniref:outer membrane beta-barrel protein n=1 Tax=Terrimonas alba TaxID=3349636 RepID=UPI0035F4707E